MSTPHAPAERRPALRTLAATLRAGKYRDETARKYFAEYVAGYHDWIAGQADVVTDSDAILALTGALVDNPDVRRAFVAARPELDRLVQVLDAADRQGYRISPPTSPIKQFEDGAIGFDTAAAPSLPPAPPPPPPGPAAPDAAPTAPKTPPTPPADPYALGREAHRQKVPLYDCPLAGDEEIERWEAGWRDEREERRKKRTPRGRKKAAEKKASSAATPAPAGEDA